MAEPLADQVMRRIDQAAELYHRLVMLVAPAGAGKTAALRDVHQRRGAPLVNVNLEWSRRMLDLTERQRALQLPRLLSEVVSQAKPTWSCWTTSNCSSMSRSSRIRCGCSRGCRGTRRWSWPGAVVDGQHLVYATPDHPEYRRYPLKDIMVVQPEVTS